MILFRDREFACTMELTLELMGGKWKGLILWHLGQRARIRFGELQRIHTRLTHKVLTQQLRELERDGIVERHVYQEVPPRVEYALTPIGLRLLPVLQAMCSWGDDYIAGSRDAQGVCSRSLP